MDKQASATYKNVRERLVRSSKLNFLFNNSFRVHQNKAAV